MIKNNLKIFDSFVVTVEVLSPNAIIVSANIDSIIYRGALIQSNATVPFIFPSNDTSKCSFSSKRLNVSQVKRNVRFKNLKSDYNLRRTNHKITKAKQIVCKSEAKEAEADSIPNHIPITEPLSIRLKKQNGVYTNMHNITEQINDDRNLKRTSMETDSDTVVTDKKRNVIKIKKIKLHSDQYHYSISTDETLVPPRLLTQSECAIQQLSPTLSTHADFFLPRLSEAPLPITSPITNSTEVDITPKNSSTSSSSSSVVSFVQPSIIVPSIDDDDVDEAESEKIDNLKPLSLSKLKIVKNTCNSYTVQQSSASKDIPRHHRYNCKDFRKNDIIWAKLEGYSNWPARVLDTDSDDEHVLVLWLGYGRQTSRLHKRKVWDFGAHFHEKYNRRSKGHYYQDAVEQARSDYAKTDYSRRSCESNEPLLETDDSIDRVCSTNVYLPVQDEEFELMPPLQILPRFSCARSSPGGGGSSNPSDTTDFNI